MKIDFRRFASGICSSQGDETLVPVVEKELVHYEVLRSLSDNGYLDVLTFQGGTCIRLCYGGERYSEDLDFAAGESLHEIDAIGMADSLSRDLLKSFDVSVRVKPPKAAGGQERVMRWVIVIDTAPERPDLPSQKIKLEVADVPARSRELMPIKVRYDAVPSSYADIVIPCENTSEILADKVISFAASSHLRYRDLWDMPWLVRLGKIDMEEVRSDVAMKYKDYSLAGGLSELMDIGRARAEESYKSREFASQMERFLPKRTFAETVGRGCFIDAMAASTRGVYDFCAPPPPPGKASGLMPLAERAALESRQTSAAGQGRGGAKL